MEGSLWNEYDGFRPQQNAQTDALVFPVPSLHFQLKYK